MKKLSRWVAIALIVLSTIFTTFSIVSAGESTPQLPGGNGGPTGRPNK